jgi:hypothetical protein
MYARSIPQPKPRKSDFRKFDAPVAGWISNRTLSDPASIEGPGAAILDNYFPRAGSVKLRRGKQLYATLEDASLPVTALFTYRNGNNRHLFAANDQTIYDVTSVLFPEGAVIVNEDGDEFSDGDGNIFGYSSTRGLDVMGGFTGGDWSTVQFATTGGVYLIGVNGSDDGFIYDGADFWPYISGGYTYLPYDAETTPFTVGETVTGGTSGATGLVFRVDPARLVLSNVAFTPQQWTVSYVSGTSAFHENSTLRGQTSNASGRIVTIAAGVTTWTLAYDGGTGDFAIGETVTGGTSSATATVTAVAGDTTSGTLTLSGLSGTFVDDEALTGSGTGVAVANGAVSTPILSGTITLEGLIGSFIQGEAIVDGSGGSAKSGSASISIGGGSFEDNEVLTGSMGGAATVNGSSSNAVPGVTFPGALTSADMSYVWVYKNRLWFIQNDDMTAWYMENPDSIGGNAVAFPLAGVFTDGGSLVFGQKWSLEAGSEGGLSEQNIFVTSQGEVAIYQGSDPSEAATWSKVGVYRIGTPMGKHAFLRGGGDLAIATSVGLVPLSKAISLDITSLNVATVSYKIADAWTDAVAARGLINWQCELWPEQKMAIISPPDLTGSSEPVMFVSNTETGAWCRYTNWHGLCLEVFEGQLYFGSPDGQIFIANVSGMDHNDTYTGTVIPLFDDMGSPGSAKIGKVARGVSRANTSINPQIIFKSDFDMSVPSPPDAVAIGASNLWGTGIWGQSVWGSLLPAVVNQNWQSVGGIGYATSIAYQVTSGSIGPVDDELIRMELTYTTAEIVT